ncbi:MAG: insulinase family protein, partial [Bifidobacteriaceae bacterium]|nr:insulinase family protein [Bifidobacteriaceae bacterium]
MTLSNVTTNDSQDLAGLEPGGAVRRSVLPGGVRLLTEHVSGVRSAAIGAWLPVGSRDEAGGHFGSTHFLEHLLFKGTARRGPLDIAEAFDKVGGEANAATAKESTCYYARVIDQDVPMAVDVLLDMVTGATLEPVAFETERGVILEELAMAGDDPQDVAHEAFAQLVYGDSPLARPIGGTPDTIRAVPRDAVWEHYRQHYRPDRLVVTAAGNIDHDALAGLVTAALKRGGWDLDPSARPVPRRSTEPQVAPPAAGGERTLAKPVEQAQVIIGCAGLRAMDPRRHVLAVLSAVLGGGMSSRLFQEIRERRGLAYSTYSFGGGHADAGSFGLYAGCGPDVAGQVAGLMEAEWERMADSGITAEELARAKGQLSGGLVLGLEDTFSRMSRLGNAEITAGELPSLDELLRRIDAVTAR